jgi:hypothetical protein
MSSGAVVSHALLLVLFRVHMNPNGELFDVLIGNEIRLKPKIGNCQPLDE